MLQELRRDDDPVVNKKRIIVNCLSPAVYPDVEEAETYGRERSIKFWKLVKMKKSKIKKKSKEDRWEEVLAEARQAPGKVARLQAKMNARLLDERQALFFFRCNFFRYYV